MLDHSLVSLKITNVHSSLSTGKLSDILRIARVGFWEYDLKTNELFLSHELRRIVGQEITSDYKQLIKSVPDEDINSIRRQIENLASAAPDFDFSFSLNHQDGAIKTYHVNGEVVLEHDKPIRLIGTLKDITDIKRIQDNLSYYELMVNVNTNAMAFVNRNYKYLAANSAFLEVTGRTVENTVGYSVADVMGEEYFNNVSKKFFDACYAGETVNTQRAYGTAAGEDTFVDINYIPYRAEDGTVIGVVIVANNVTGFKNIQETLEENEKLLKEAQRIAKLGYWKRNLNTEVMTMSEELYEIYGIPADRKDVTRQEIFGLIHPEDRENVIGTARNIIDAGFEYKADHRIIRPDGGIRHVNVLAEVKVDALGKPSYVFGTVLDVTDAKQVEDKLRRYEQIINTTSDFMAFVDRDYIYQSANQGYLDTFGKDWEELVGHSMPEILGQEFFETEIKPKLDRSMAGESLDFERWVSNQGPGPACLDVRYRPFYDWNGIISGVVVIIRDITEKKRFEEMLIRYENIVNASSDIMIIIDKDFNYLAVNSRFLEKINKSYEEVIGFSIQDVLGNEYFEKFIKQNMQKCFSGESINYQCWHDFHHSEKEYSDVTYIPYRHTDGTVQGAVITIHDITNLKLAQESMEKSEQQLLEAQRIAQLGFWEWNVVEDTIYRSKVGDQMMGLDRETMGDDYLKRNDDRFHPDDRERIVDSIEKALRGEQTYNIKHRILKFPDNEIRHIHVMAEISHDSNGNPVKMFGTMQDITQTVQYEQELAKHRDHLEELVKQRTSELEATQKELLRNERLATLGQLTATVSHELRNPLAATNLAVHTLRKYIKDDNPLLMDTFSRLKRNISRCDNIIDELLDFTRTSNFELQPTHFETWLKEVLDDLVPSENLKVQLDLNVNDLVIQIDPGHLRRAVINVFENARHAMLIEGDDRELIPGAKITLTSLLLKNRMELTITDKGKGIPEDVLPNIFEPLFSTKNFGVGLGLPTVRQIMEQHGGGIEINSKAGTGTSVVLWLPESLVLKKVAS